MAREFLKEYPEKSLEELLEKCQGTIPTGILNGNPEIPIRVCGTIFGKKNLIFRQKTLRNSH